MNGTQRKQSKTVGVVVATDRGTRRRMKRILGLPFTPSVEFAREYQLKMMEQAGEDKPKAVKVNRETLKPAFEDA